MGEALENFLSGSPQTVNPLPDGIVIRQAQEIGRPKMETMDAVSLMAMRFDRFHMPVVGMIVEGVTLLCGSSKIGKSWLVLSMCCAVANGNPFLGRATEQGKVLYLALEDSPRRLQSRMAKIGEKPTANLSFATQAKDIDGGLIEDLTNWVKSVDNPQMIVIDTFQKVRGATPARTNAYSADYAVMSKLKRFADSNHVAVVLVHHLNKMRDVADPYDKISGSTGLMGAADTTILVNRDRDSDDATVTFTGRDVCGDDLNIRITDGRWQAVGPEVAAREAYEKNHIVRTCKKLLMESFDETVKITTKDLQEAIQLRTGYVFTAQELGRKVEQIAPQMLKYDRITLAHKKVGRARGVWISMADTVQEETEQTDLMENYDEL